MPQTLHSGFSPNPALAVALRSGPVGESALSPCIFLSQINFSYTEKESIPCLRSGEEKGGDWPPKPLAKQQCGLDMGKARGLGMEGRAWSPLDSFPG